MDKKNEQQVFYKIVCVNSKGERVSAVLRQVNRGKWRVVYVPGKRTTPNIPGTKLFAWFYRDCALQMALNWSGWTYERWRHEVWECTIENPVSARENEVRIPLPYDRGVMRSFWQRMKDFVYPSRLGKHNIVLGDSITLTKLIWSSDR